MKKLNLPSKSVAFINKYSAELSRVLSDSLYGIYLYGSIALGDFHEDCSDFDMITLLKRPLTSQELDDLALIHTKLREADAETSKIDNIFMQLSDIGKSNKELSPYPFCGQGDFSKKGYWDLNYVTWWILKKHGIALIGNSVDELELDVSVEDLKRTMDYNLNSYWKSKINVPYQDEKEIVWAVSTLCRIIYTLAEGDVTSKRKAVKYYLKKAPMRWQLVLKECLRIYEEPGEQSLFNSKDEREVEVAQFMEYVIDSCQTHFA